jgi:putative ABC transport system ATP-binding protein
MTQKITIECKDLTKSFSNGNGGSTTYTLRGINMTAHTNETIMLMGPSGVGKTTLISIIGGLMQQDSGDCLVLEKSINSLPGDEKTTFRGKNIGFMFQYFNLVPTLTAIENVAIPLILNGIHRKEAFEKASILLLSMDLDEQRFRRPNNLSGGEQQRVAIARACIHNPRIILCDEPTSFLDKARGEKIMLLLKKIREETECTLIIVTHDQRILKFADTILEIEDGIIKTLPKIV